MPVYANKVGSIRLLQHISWHVMALDSNVELIGSHCIFVAVVAQVFFSTHYCDPAIYLLITPPSCGRSSQIYQLHTCAACLGAQHMVLSLQTFPIRICTRRHVAILGLLAVTTRDAPLPSLLPLVCRLALSLGQIWRVSESNEAVDTAPRGSASRRRRTCGGTCGGTVMKPVKPC